MVALHLAQCVISFGGGSMGDELLMGGAQVPLSFHSLAIRFLGLKRGALSPLPHSHDIGFSQKEMYMTMMSGVWHLLLILIVFINSVCNSYNIYLYFICYV